MDRSPPWREGRVVGGRAASAPGRGPGGSSGALRDEVGMWPGGPVVAQRAVVELEQAVRQGVVALVVADGDDQLASRLELGQQAPVEDLLEVRVLVRGPLVEEVDRAVFEPGGE